MHAFVLALDEAQQVVHLRHQVAVVAEDFPGIVQSDFGAKDQFVGFGQGLDYLGREVVPFKPTALIQRGLAGYPSTSMYGGTSWRTALQPATKL